MNVFVEPRHLSLALGALTIALVFAVPVATWWLVGDLSTTIDDPDFVVQPPAISPTQERLLGVGSLIVVVGTTLVLVVAAGLGRLDWRWWAVLTLLAGLASSSAGAIGC